MPLTPPLAIVCSVRPLTPVWQGRLGETAEAEETLGPLIQGGEIVLSNYFDDDILAEQIPWAGPVLRIVSQSDSERGVLGRIHFTPARDSQKRNSPGRTEGRQREAKRGFPYISVSTARFPERLAGKWVAYLSIK